MPKGYPFQGIPFDFSAKSHYSAKFRRDDSLFALPGRVRIEGCAFSVFGLWYGEDIIRLAVTNPKREIYCFLKAANR